MSAELAKVIKDKMDETRAAVRAWLQASVPQGWTIVDQNQYVPRPKPPYVSFGFLGGMTKLGRADSFPYDKRLHAFKVRMHRQATLSISAFGTPFTDKYVDLLRATDMLTIVQAHIDEPVAYGALEKRGIAIWGDNSVIDTTYLEENVYQPAATLDLLLGISMEATIDPGSIERVRISGKLDADFDGTFEMDFGPFTIPMEDDST